MKLLFLCSSLEPGRDGVGDYTRALAAACTSPGVECRLLALNDDHVTTPSRATQSSGPLSFNCLRLPAAQDWSTRLALATDFVETFSPDHLSWQIVPYGFHPKGIIPDELHAFSALGRGRHTHAMLHELWIGLSRGEPLKNRIYGRLQRAALMKFLRAIDPASVDTSNVVYQAVLAAQDCLSTILPLFGNIPIAPVAPPPPSDREWTGAIFGTIHPQLDPHPCFTALIAGARSSGRTLRILGIGRVGTYGGEMFARLRTGFGDTIKAELLGEKSATEVSRLLQHADFGIATHPWALLGKSGAVAAMLDHGLPVIVPRNDWILRQPALTVPAIDPLAARLADVPPELMAGWLRGKRPASPHLPAVARTFLSRLGAGAPATVQPA